MAEEYGYGHGHAGDQHHSRTSEYGKPVRQTDEYGRQVDYTTTMGDYSSTGTVGAYRTDENAPTGGFGGPHVTGTGTDTAPHQGSRLHRSGSSSSSSSSEDDGMGGRRKKKGLKEKIKEKLPGSHGHKQDTSTTTTTPGYGVGEQPHQHHEKKGMMEKIKEKLPGGHH